MQDIFARLDALEKKDIFLLIFKNFLYKNKINMIKYYMYKVRNHIINSESATISLK